MFVLATLRAVLAYNAVVCLIYHAGVGVTGLVFRLEVEFDLAVLFYYTLYLAFLALDVSLADDLKVALIYLEAVQSTVNLSGVLLYLQAPVGVSWSDVPTDFEASELAFVLAAKALNLLPGVVNF